VVSSSAAPAAAATAAAAAAASDVISAAAVAAPGRQNEAADCREAELLRTATKRSSAQNAAARRWPPSGHMFYAREADGWTHGGSNDTPEKVGRLFRGCGHTDKPATRKVPCADTAAARGNVDLRALGAAQRRRQSQSHSSRTVLDVCDDGNRLLSHSHAQSEQRGS